MSKGKGSQPSGQTTTTSTSQPWATQQPYLTDVMAAAKDLYNNFTPAYYPSSTYAPMTGMQNNALQSINSIGMSQPNSAILQNANNLTNNLTSGALLTDNPGINPLVNAGSSNPLSSNAVNLLTNFSNQHLPASVNAAANMENAFAGGANPGTLSAGNPTLESFSSGMMTNPYLASLSQSVLSNVVPSIQAQFINGGGLSNPQAAYATSQGATAALAPILAQQFQQEQQNQLGAAGTLASNFLTGSGQQASVMNNYGNLGLGAAGVEQNAANSLNSSLLGNKGLNINALNNAGSLYNSGLNPMVQALALTPQTMSAALSGPEAALNAGGQYQGDLQNQINAAIQEWNYGQQLPYQKLNEFLGQVSGNYGGMGSVSSPYYMNQGGNALSGGLSGAMLGASLGPTLLGTSTGVGAAGGAGLGALFALLSDRRAKENIVRVGTLDNGLPVYAFRYYGDARMQIGLMADEVEDVHPEAVIDGPFGFKMVDYSQAVQ